MQSQKLDASSWLKLGYVLHEQGEFRAAAEMIARASELGMDNGRLWRELGQCYCMCALLASSALPGRDAEDQCPGHFISLASDAFDECRRHLGGGGGGESSRVLLGEVMYHVSCIASYRKREEMKETLPTPLRSSPLFLTRTPEHVWIVSHPYHTSISAAPFTPLLVCPRLVVAKTPCRGVKGESGW